MPNKIGCYLCEITSRMMMLITGWSTLDSRKRGMSLQTSSCPHVGFGVVWIKIKHLVSHSAPFFRRDLGRGFQTILSSLGCALQGQELMKDSRRRADKKLVPMLILPSLANNSDADRKLFELHFNSKKKGASASRKCPQYYCMQYSLRHSSSAEEDHPMKRPMLFLPSWMKFKI